MLGPRLPASSFCTKDYFLNTVLGKLEHKKNGNGGDIPKRDKNEIKLYYATTLEHL